MRSIIGMAFGALVLSAVGLLSTPASAQWIDAATGQPVNSGPIISTPTQFPIGFYPRGVRPDPSDPSHAFDPETGRNFYFDGKRCVWVDSSTGQPVNSGPIISTPTQFPIGFYPRGVRPDPSDPSRAFDPETGRNFVMVKRNCGQKEAAAAQLPTQVGIATPAPSINFSSTGMYSGVGFGTLATICPTWTTTGVDSLGSSDPVGADNQACHSIGFLTSAYVGYQWTLASLWLAGIETDIGYATNSATTGVPGVSNAPGDNVSVKEDWNGSVRARLGYGVAPNTVLYGTAGVAFQHLQATVTCTGASPFPCGRFGPVAPITATNTPTLTGWTVGGGAEYAMTGNLRLRAEYRYSDYGTYNATYGNPANLAVSSGIRLRTNMATVGLTFAFGAPSTPTTASRPALITK